MALSENNWPVLPPDSNKLYTWKIPTKSGVVELRMHNGSVGFLLAYAVMLFSDLIEAVHGKILDDWGYAYRVVRAGYLWSNHSSGTAVDLNAMRHVLGKVGTLAKAAAWRVLLRTRLNGLLRWGGDYHNRKDEMHTEIAPGTTMAQCEKLAKLRMKTKRGQALMKANPSQATVIYS